MVVRPIKTTKPYLFRRGKVDDLPVLIALGDREAGLLSMLQFCRQVLPGSPILILNPLVIASAGAPTRDPSQASGASRKMVVNALASHIRTAIRAHDLALMPIIVVAHGEGADIACELLFDHGNLFAAGVLLRPSGRPPATTSRSAVGLHILLAQTEREEEAGSDDQTFSKALAHAGAEVICERVLPARKPDSGDAIMARVFIAALFGP